MIYISSDIENIASQVGISASSIPEFWQGSVNNVINTIKSLHKDGGKDCTTFAFFSDNHQRNGYSGRLIKYIMDACYIPYCFYGGDSISSGYINSEETMINQDRSFDSIMSCINDGRFKRAVGNHDGYWAVSSSEKHYYNRSQIYDLFLREESVHQNMIFGYDGTYYYVDDKASKIRFIILNTNGIRDENSAITGGTIDDNQIYWLQNVALSFNESGWGVVFISHQPISNHYHAEINNASTVRTIIKNYIDGLDTNKADIVGWFSGHIHRDRIYTGVAVNTSNDTEGDNMGFTQVTITSDHTGIAYDDSTKHTVAEDNLSHAIDFVTINKSTKLVNITRLGIGENRVYSYTGSSIYHSITNNLSNAITSNNSSSIISGSSYSATISINNGYELTSVKVTMAGVDITNDAYKDGTITIAEVTGNIIITVTTVAIEAGNDTTIIPITWKNGYNCNYDVGGTCKESVGASYTISECIECSVGDTFEITCSDNDQLLNSGVARILELDLSDVILVSLSDCTYTLNKYKFTIASENAVKFRIRCYSDSYTDYLTKWVLTKINN